ncbi:adenosine kinase [Sphingomonas sp. HDW15A]|uniref:adenosine kinase n=1 Tax=Sphingomonas sp. HDW15A TaxID=2714942 RepID=UPI001409187A|nr:adenosine kinase [Sphingomonas sp. HDW15A]QIK96280.1 adenosine kinase [Sphingomonas sp. HDW15A]
MDSQYDIVAIGDAIVDVIATCDDAFLAEHDLPKGSMQLLDTDAADRLYAAMGTAQETSGGSAANSMAGIAAMGGRAAFIGQVADDQLGTIFRHDMTALGVDYDTPPLANGSKPTGRCLILVTPDAHRTMNTCPGASHELTPDALDSDKIANSAILFLEGYLWGPEKPRAAMLKAIETAHAANREIAFTLSESVCMPGRRETFSQMIRDRGIDLLFANELELMQLTGDQSLGQAIASVADKVPCLVVTRGEHGAIAFADGEGVEVPAAPVERVVDTTGAGDLFAAGFLAARARRHDLARCLHTGATAAAEIISHFGARPEADLKALVRL